MIAIAVCALFLRIAVEKIIQISTIQNESNASLTLKLISTALENYAKDKQGAYPSNFSALIKTNPAYLDKDYVSLSPIKGYYYACPRLEASGYNCYATPVKCNLTGGVIYAVSTGGLLTNERCSRKE
ncbi:MAG: hypothetical protein PHO70_00035 [Candidatus Omnitrophica bacterium]|nr:hypothetical protein [Candidatus Omnitrophota bacterium]